VICSMLKIDLSKRAARFLKRLPIKQAKQITRRLMALRESSMPNDAKQLKGTPYIRIDSGEYRIVYAVQGDFVKILLIGKRNDGEVCKKLKRLM
jgi:mRNA interferase RelE/StbE